MHTQFWIPRSEKTFVMDYSAAIASAVAWLGNRYLLAKPVERLTPEERRRANLAANALGQIQSSNH